MADNSDRLAVLEERVSNWMSTTVDYRDTLCKKLDRISEKMDTIKDKVNNLPCDTRVEIYKNITKNIYALWGFIGAIILIIIKNILGG